MYFNTQKNHLLILPRQTQFDYDVNVQNIMRMTDYEICDDICNLNNKKIRIHHVNIHLHPTSMV